MYYVYYARNDNAKTIKINLRDTSDTLTFKALTRRNL